MQEPKLLLGRFTCVRHLFVVSAVRTVPDGERRLAATPLLRTVSGCSFVSACGPVSVFL